MIAMKYDVTVNKEYHYVKVYKILKKVNESTNPISIAFAKFIDKLTAGKSKAAE